MKRIVLVISLLIFSFTFLSFQHSQHTRVIQSLKKNVLSRTEKTLQLNQTLKAKAKSQQSSEDLIAALKECRLSYKTIEHHVIFAYPALHKRINGGPVYGVQTDVVQVFRIDPSGYQVLEEVLSEDEVNYEEIIKQVDIASSELEKFHALFSAQQFGYWQVFEAQRMQLVTMVTLSISGFDSPALVQGLPESKKALETAYEEIQMCDFLIKDESLKNEVNRLYERAIKDLKGQDFNVFDRFTFMRDVSEPLYGKLLDFHVASGYETYDEVSPRKRGFNYKVRGIFDEDFLNPFYSLRGANANISTMSEERIALGKLLFFDPVLSANNERSCASCHNPTKGFSDNAAKSLGFDFKGTVQRNSPTVINSCYQSNFFWDLRSGDLNNQIEHVVESDKEFNTDFQAIRLKLASSQEYIDEFKKAYGNREVSTLLSVSNIKDALEAYVRDLRGMNSPFDRYMRGEEKAPKEVVKGFNVFMGKAACGTCHFLPNFNGYVPPHFDDTEGEILGVPTTAAMDSLDSDMGRYALYALRHPEHTFMKGMFKTPTLRNVALTFPYMHNGALTTLEEVVEFYDRGGGQGLGFDIPSQTLAPTPLALSDKEKQALVVFMESLTDTTGMTSVPTRLPSFGDAVLDARVIGGKY